MSAINQWLETLGLGQYAEVFAANDIDMEVLPELTEEDLKTLGVSMGHRKKLMKAIVALSAPDTEALPETAPTPTPPEPSTRAPSEGERRQATVLFSDLSGYTAMNETLDPEEVEGLMSRIKAEALGIVERHGGLVNQFVGDEVLALFGIPTAHEDDPVRAVRAALEMHEMVRQMSPEVEGRIGQPLRLHTGINTGLIVTNLRDARDGLIGITGDAVNTGARLKAEASVDAILVSPETKRLVADFYHTEALEPVEMKGKTQPVTPYCVLGKTQVATRFEAAAQRGLSKFTGREQELTVFHDCLEKAMAGQGQFLTVVGAAGVGKSRLLFEFRHSLDREKVTVLEGRCQSYGAKTPYFPWLDALRRGLQLRDADTLNDMHQKVVTNVRAVDPSLEQYLPFYLHLLSIPSMQYPLPAEFQGDELSRLFEEALGAIYTLRAQSQPIVAIFEDWHWVDEDSETAMKYLVGLMHSSPLLVVVLYRPEYSASWGDLSHHTPIVLQSLDHRHTQDIVRSVLDAKELPEGLTSLIQERTGGNPFFIEEVCHALKAEGTVVVSEGRATLNRSLDALHIPDSVHAVIRTRVDRLNQDSQEALRLASVIGREFGRRILERMYSRQSQLLHTLEGLKIEDLILQVRVLPEVEYMFKHVLTQVVVYETLLLQRRKDLHRLVARTIEDLYADRLEEQYKTLAYHYQRSTEPEKGVNYLERAGDCNKEITHSAEARRNYWEAIHVLDALESTPERKRYRIDLNLKLASISADSAPSEEHIATLHRSIEYARELGSRAGSGNCSIGRATCTS